MEDEGGVYKLGIGSERKLDMMSNVDVGCNLLSRTLDMWKRCTLLER